MIQDPEKKNISRKTQLSPQFFPARHWPTHKLCRIESENLKVVQNFDRLMISRRWKTKFKITKVVRALGAEIEGKREPQRREAFSMYHFFL